MFGMLVEIDNSTLEMEELEYARVLIKLPISRETCWANCMMINKSMCQIAIEEDHVFKVERCCNHDLENYFDDDELGINLGEECFALEGSEIGRNLKFNGGIGEETTVEAAEELLRRESQRTYIATEVMCADVEGQ